MHSGVEQPAQTLKPVYSVDEAADVLRVSASLMWRLVREGSIKPTKIGRRTLIPVEEIRRIAAEGAK